jgi:hypothetical protein
MSMQAHTACKESGNFFPFKRYGTAVSESLIAETEVYPSFTLGLP